MCLVDIHTRPSGKKKNTVGIKHKKSKMIPNKME